MTSNYSTLEVEEEEIEYKNVNITFYILSIISHLPNFIIVHNTLRWQIITA